MLAASVAVPLARSQAPAVARPLVKSRAQIAGSGGSSAPAVTAQTESQASLLAASSGQPVEVLADRTDWTQVFAEPAGGFLSQISAAPVRVKEPDGSWDPIDTTLSVLPDGSVAPNAIVPGLVLSGGGSGPLMTVSQATGDPAGSVSVSWPYGPLPAPSLSGPTATYANVLPGVNLLVTAAPTGVDTVLQVMSAAAAALPQLAKVSFPVSSPGLSMAADGQGGVTMSDPAGSTLFTELPTQMWDSAGLPATQGLSTAAEPAAPGGLAAAGAAGGSVPAGLAGPVPGDHVGVAAVSASPTSISVSPVASVLDSSSTVYPVYIDPGITYSHTQTGWLDVAHDFNGYNSGGNGGPCAAQGGSWNCWGNWDYEDPDGGIRAGVWCNGPSNPPEPPPPSNICYDSYPDSTWGVYRSYLNFDLPSSLSGADYVDAQLSLYDVWSYSCSSDGTLELWQTSTASQDGYWGNKPSEQNWQDSSTKAYGNVCNSGGITMNASGAVSAAAASGSGEVTLEVRASLSSEQASPPDLTNWRRFQATGSGCADVGTGGYPCLQVFWMHKPDVATATGTEGTFDAASGQTVTHCSTSEDNPDYIDTATPWLDASVTDPDSGLASFKGWIQWTEVYPDSGSATFGGAYVQSDNSFRDQVPSGTFTDETEYEWQAQGVARATDPLTGNSVAESGPWSSPCYIMVDLPSDGGVPDVVGTVQGSSTSNWTVGKPGTVTLTDPAYPALGPDNDDVGFLYSVGSSQPTHYIEASYGTAMITIKPYTEATESVYAQAVDAAGNLGPVNTSSPYTFTASAGTKNVSTLAYWPLNGSGADRSSDGNDLTLTQNASFPCSSTPNNPGYKCVLALEADTSAGVVSPESGFSVSSWVTNDGSSCQATTCVAMSEDADPQNSNHSSVFWLGYEGSGMAGYPGTQAQCPCWVFEVWPSDSSTVNPVVAAIHATSAQQQGSWAQLDGVFDPASLTATLYVNGSSGSPPGAAVQVVPGPWAPTIPGPVRLGAGPPGNSADNIWPGNVSDACVFYGPLSDKNIAPGQNESDIATLYAGGTADGCSALFGSYP